MAFAIHAGAAGTIRRNFWNNVHFHPTDAVEDLWGQEILNRWAAVGTAQYLRLYTMFEDMVSRDDDGTLVFDFSDQDRRLDFAVSNGFKLLLCFNFMPVAMAADPVNLSGKRYKDKYFCRAIMARHGFADTPAVIDEWAAAAEGYLGIEQDPRMRFRETEYYAAFYFRLIDLMSRLELPPERMMICLSGQDFNSKDFDGHRTFFTARGWCKPIGNAFALAAKLGEDRLPCETELPRDTGVIATRRADGAVVVAFYNHVSEFGRFGRTEVIPFEADGLPERYELRRWRIDQVFSNAFTAWSRLGCPGQPTVWEREQISRHARLEEARDAAAGGRTFSGEVVLTPNSVELFEFKPV